jgi:acetyl esterase/lipase
MTHLPYLLDRVLSTGGTIQVDGNTLDSAIQSVMAAQRAAGVTGLVFNDDPVATRTHMREASLALAGPSVPLDVIELAIPGPEGEIPARHYRPVTAGPSPLLVFFHGGGFVFGDLDSYDALARQICRDGAVHVLAVDYRLAPEHKAPAAVDDAYTAFRWAAQHAERLGAIPDRVAVGGDSAGGTLAAVVAQLARNDGGPVPALQLLIYPVIDFNAETRSRALFAEGFLLTAQNLSWFAQQYLEGSGVANTAPRVAPLLAEDLSRLAPAIVITAGFDPLRDEGAQYATAMRDAGVAVDLVDMPSLTHGFINFGALDGACSLAIAAIISALRAHLIRE